MTINVLVSATEMKRGSNFFFRDFEGLNIILQEISALIADPIIFLIHS